MKATLVALLFILGFMSTEGGSFYSLDLPFDITQVESQSPESEDEKKQDLKQFYQLPCAPIELPLLSLLGQGLYTFTNHGNFTLGSFFHSNLPPPALS